MSPKSTKSVADQVQAQAMFEIAVALGRYLAQEGCTLETGKAVFDVFTQLYEDTVGKGLTKKPKIWDDAGTTYVFKQIRKIALCAAYVAKDTNQDVVSAAILQDCAWERIVLEKQNCSYAAGLNLGLGWRNRPWGDFCPTGES